MASGSPTTRVQPYRSASQGPIGSLPGFVGSYGPLGSNAASGAGSAYSFIPGMGLTSHRPDVTPLPTAIPPAAASFAVIAELRSDPGIGPPALVVSAEIQRQATAQAHSVPEPLICIHQVPDHGCCLEDLWKSRSGKMPLNS